MEMIIGGAFQGKSAYAKKKYPHICWTEAEELEEQDLMNAQGVLGFHNYIKKELKKGNDLSSLSSMLIQNNPGLIIVSDEVGYGIVPVDAFERTYRECVGRICTDLAAASSIVTRVVCGIGMVIKVHGTSDDSSWDDGGK